MSSTLTASNRGFDRVSWAGLFALLLLLGTTGCATVLSEKRYPVTIENATAPTYFSVHDRKNQVIHQGVTPQQVTLDAKAFPFWPAKYSVVFAGHEAASETHELKAGLDPWVAGNLVLGGVPGTLVDGATGAMFRLPKSVKGTVPPQFAVTDPNMGSAIARASSRTPSENAAQQIPTQATQGQVMMASGESQATGGGEVTAQDGSVIRAANATQGDIVPGTLMR